MRIIMLCFALAPAVLGAQASRDTARARRDSATTLETVTVAAIRARDEAPISSSTIHAAEIERRSFGQDVPLLVQGTPSLTSYAETGNHWGYSYMRLRGIDQSRINLTLDGIPLNDPEDQVLYFADFPDLANSINSIQVQRGVGTSAPGTASYGGSINFESASPITTPRGAELQLQGGSFGSARASAEYASGMLADRFAMYGRLSALRSSGYRQHSGMEGRSGFLSAAWMGDRDLVKLTAVAGFFADTLAYVGGTEAELAQNRRLNPLRPDEVDRFGEQVAALSYTRSLGNTASLASTAYRISASGQYDVCIANCDQPQGDLWNFNLDFVWYGATSVWSIDRDRLRASVGVNANTYARDHHAYARPDLGQPLYFNTGHKEDQSAFAKVAYDIGRLTLFGDVQGRHARFGYTPDVNAGIAPSSISWTFFNPKAGATIRVTPTMDAYASYGMNGREPARGDMFAGFDNLDTTNVAFVGPLSRVRPERVADGEAGVRVRAGGWSLDANAFAMQFKSEILPVGRLSVIGTPLRTNVGSSWRRGVEAVLRAEGSRVRAQLTATGMRARIASFTDDETGQSFRNVEPLLTPNLVSSQFLSMSLTPTFSLDVTGQYSGRAQLTNTGDPTLRLPPSYVANLSLHWQRDARGLTLHLNNVSNSTRFASGHVSFGEARYYVLPPRNVVLIARLGTS
jgi:iron complex outermembrane receptor protein